MLLPYLEVMREMYFKLALKNVKRSFKDYTLYFFTLVLGICIFYIFNSIESQEIMFSLSNSYEEAFKIISESMNIISYFVAFILGFLIIYANNFLVKRRKKEFGIYMILGMDSKKILRLLFIETLFIGVISLITGLIIGIFISQGLSVFTSKMFDLKLINFQFVFSKSSFIKTCICFGIMYVTILIFDSFSIKNISLKELLNASKINERLKIRNSISIVIFFGLSVISIITAYYLVMTDSFAVISTNLVKAAILGCIGTFCFFFSLSGFLLKSAKANKKFYFKNLNMFILKSINSKINTTFISMTFICLMLFLAVCMLSGGLGLNMAINETVKDTVQFDATFNNLNGYKVDNILKENNIDLNEYCSNVTNYDLYYDNLGYQDLFKKYITNNEMSFYPIASNEKIPIMKLSDFNNILSMLNKDPITIKQYEYIFFKDTNSIENILNDFIKDDQPIVINGKKVIPVPNSILSVNINNNIVKNNFATIVVNDDIVYGINNSTSFTNITFKHEMEDKLNSKISSLSKDVKSDINYVTKEQALAESFQLGAQLSYISIYVGIVFLVTCAATLAIQQLSECDNNIERYRVIKKIGVDEKMISKSLFLQIGIYFMVPLSLAFIHSIVGLKVCSKFVMLFTDGGEIKANILFTACICLVIYGGYFWITYLGTKKIIKKYI